jgi:hypothetical protein
MSDKAKELQRIEAATASIAELLIIVADMVQAIGGYCEELPDGSDLGPVNELVKHWCDEIRELSPVEARLMAETFRKQREDEARAFRDSIRDSIKPGGVAFVSKGASDEEVGQVAAEIKKWIDATEAADKE